MDYADATLVDLGEEVGCGQVFTLDRCRLSSYHLQQRKSFRIVPRVLAAFRLRAVAGLAA